MKSNGRSMSMPGGIAVGVCTSLIMTIAGAMLLSWLVMDERVEEQAIGYGAMAILFMGALLGCLVAWGKIRHRRLMVTGICAAGYYLALLAVGLLFGGVREGLGAAAVMICLGGGISLIPTFLGRGSGGRKHRIRQFR